MTESDREFLKEFVELLKGERAKSTWIPAIMDLIKIGSIVWGAAMIVGEVQTLRRDVTAQGVAIERTQDVLLTHLTHSARAVENVDNRLQTLETVAGIPPRRIPEAK